MQNKEKNLNVRLEPQLASFMRIYAASKQMTVSDVIRNFCTMICVISDMKGNKKVIASIMSDKRKKSFVKFLKELEQ